MLTPQRILHRTFETIRNHPDRLLDWAMVFGLTFLLRETLVYLGGYLPYGQALTGPWTVLWFLLAGHSLWWALRKGPAPVRWWALVPVPLLVWGWVQGAWLSSAPWWGGLTWVNWLGAWLVFWIIAHQLRTRLQLLWLFVLCLLVILEAAAVGLYQDFFQPEFFAVAGRAPAEWLLGRAAGYFGVPNNLAAYLLLGWPAAVCIVAMPRFPGPMRLFALMIACILVAGILATGSRGGLIGLGACALVLPWCLVPTWRQRVGVFCGFVLGTICLLFGAYLGSAQFSERLDRAILDQGEVTRPVMWEGAWRMFEEAPLTGQGLGGFEAEWDVFRPAGPSLAPRYAHNDYLQLLAETGVVGTALALLTLGGLAFWLWQRWRQIPFFQLAPGQDARVLESLGITKPRLEPSPRTADAGDAKPVRRRRRRKKEHHPAVWYQPLVRFMGQGIVFILLAFPVCALVLMGRLHPSAFLLVIPAQVLGNVVLMIARDDGGVQRCASGRLIGAAVLVGLLGVSVHAMVDFPWQLPAILWMGTALLALGLRAVEPATVKEAHLPRWALYAMALLPLVVGTLGYRYAVPRLLAQHAYLIAEEQLLAAEKARDDLLREPWRVYQPVAGFQRALLLNPEHGPAWVGLGHATLLIEAVDLQRPREYFAAQAMPALQRGRELYPSSWEARHYLAYAAWYLERPTGEVEALFREAMARAPQRPEPLIGLGNFMWADGAPTEAISALVEQAYALDPTYGPTLELRLRVGLK